MHCALPSLCSIVVVAVCITTHTYWMELAKELSSQRAKAGWGPKVPNPTLESKVRLSDFKAACTAPPAQLITQNGLTLHCSLMQWLTLAKFLDMRLGTWMGYISREHGWIVSLHSLVRHFLTATFMSPSGERDRPQPRNIDAPWLPKLTSWSQCRPLGRTMMPLLFQITSTKRVGPDRWFRRQNTLWLAECYLHKVYKTVC